MNLFDNISKKDILRMTDCFGATVKEYRNGDTITELSGELTSIGLVLEGKAHLYYIDYDGNFQIIEYFSEDDVFGELFCLPIGCLEYIIEADSDCRIMFIPYTAITSPCGNACTCHTELTRNLFLMASKKSQELALRLSIISRKTVRQKLATYFDYMADLKGSNEFKTHISLSRLADYMCVDRTSLMRELKNMKNEGIIESEGRKITLLC